MLRSKQPVRLAQLRAFENYHVVHGFHAFDALGNVDRLVDIDGAPDDAARLDGDTNPLPHVRQRTEWWVPGTDNRWNSWTFAGPAILEKLSASPPTPP